MARVVGWNLLNVAAPLLFFNFTMYIIVVGFASWGLDRFIDAQTHHPELGGNGATMLFLIFAILGGVVGVASTLAGGNHLSVGRSESLAAAASSALVAWAITALSFGLACKEISLGGYRGWRLEVLEAFTAILTFTQLIYFSILKEQVEMPPVRQPDVC